MMAVILEARAPLRLAGPARGSVGGHERACSPDLTRYWHPTASTEGVPMLPRSNFFLLQNASFVL